MNLDSGPRFFPQLGRPDSGCEPERESGKCEIRDPRRQTGKTSGEDRRYDELQGAGPKCEYRLIFNSGILISDPIGERVNRKMNQVSESTGGGRGAQSQQVHGAKKQRLKN